MVHHHNYLTHRPAFWLALLVLGVVLAHRGGILRAMAAGGVAHVMLDTITGQIDWGWPLIDLKHALIAVKASQDWWVMSFILHWSFGIELAITGFAALLWWQERRRDRALRGLRAGA